MLKRKVTNIDECNRPERLQNRGGVALRDVGICVVICPVFLCPCAAVCPPLLASSGIPLHHGKCQSARPRPSVFSICSPLPFCCESCIWVWCRWPSRVPQQTRGRCHWCFFTFRSILCLYSFHSLCVCNICMFVLNVFVWLRQNPRNLSVNQAPATPDAVVGPQTSRLFSNMICRSHNCILYCLFVSSTVLIL